MSFTQQFEHLINVFSGNISPHFLQKTYFRGCRCFFFHASKLFEQTASGVRLNARELGKLETAYRKQQRQKIDDELERLTKEYNDLTQQINRTSDSVSRADLYAQRNKIAEQINDISLLASEYDGLLSSFNAWQEAQSTSNEGAN